MSQPAVGVLAEELVDCQKTSFANSIEAEPCSPTSRSFSPAISDTEICERREEGTAVVAALPPASPIKHEVLDLTSSNRTPFMDLSVKPKLANQVPPVSSMLPSALLGSTRSVSNPTEVLTSTSSFHSRNNSSKCVISVNASNVLGNPTCASPNDDHLRNSVDLAAGLITIDTSSLSSIDAASLSTSFHSKSAVQKSNKVTAQGTIVPPLANSIQDSAILQDSSSSSSASAVLSSSIPSSRNQEISATSQDHLGQADQFCSSQIYSELPFSGSEKKNTLKLNCASKLLTSHSKQVSEPCSDVFTNGHEHHGTSSTSFPASASSSPCRASLSPSPSCSESQGIASGAGSEVRGMPAIPVPAAPGRPKEAQDPSASGSMDNTDGGRLTFFKEGKLLLELSHRSANESCAINKDGKKTSGCWVQIETNTFWPPSSCRANISTPLHFPFSGYGKAARRKIRTPRRCEQQSNGVVQPPLSCSASPTKDDASHRCVGAPVPETFLFVCPELVRAFRRSYGPLIARRPFHRFSEMDALLELDDTRKQALLSLMRECRNLLRRSSSQEGNRILQKHKLEKYSKVLAEQQNLKIDSTIKVGQIFERVMLKTPSPNNFVSPRKRYLKQFEADHEIQNKKKIVMATSSASRPASYMTDSYQNYTSSKNVSARHSALNNYGAAHTIESILNHSEKRNESYLKSLFKSEGKKSPRSSSRSPLTLESVKQEPEMLMSVKPDRDASRNSEMRSSRDCDERQSLPSYSASPHSRSSPPSPRSARASHASNTSVKNRDQPDLPYPGYGMTPQTLASLYPQLYDPNYFFINGPLAAGGLMASPHSQMAVAAAAAAAAAASISSMSSYGLAPLQLQLAATQYSSLFNPVAFAPAIAAAAAASPLSPSIAAPLTPALTPGAVALSMPHMNSSTLPSAHNPSLSLPHVVTSHHPSFINSVASHQSRSSPYPTPSPHPRSPYSPSVKSFYPPTRSPQSRSRSPPSRSPVMMSTTPTSYHPRKPHPPPHHYPQPAMHPSSPWRPVAAHQHPPPTLSSSQDTPLNLTKPRCQ
ncbi:protein hairless [Hyalella azteca]|uniref:Protein hairless n=1 Tax=Hyalella azteca TaxID=294128 RepID=A0A8B7PMJ1_HYAAZ|nr:protein hairless [Hyalella azteca]XP_018027414.1 protein hairless [Hyalella azteca]XP_018027415.1 protein hairless [Hyalella azteca]XP_018027416.1 protein hairless [Hyalella azteca]XP_047741215.1 protein hairless [Hyalella azteca]